MGEFLAITVLIMLAAISPGPDFAMVVKNSLTHSRKGGVYTAIGITCSLLFHTSYCIMGLAIVISQSLLLFTVIKYIGAAYLMYIGVKSLLADHSPMHTTYKASHHSLSRARAFRQGFLCNALNPKAILFMLAFFTLVIKPSTPLWIQISIALEIALIHIVWFSGLAIFLTHHKVSKFLAKAQVVVSKVMGGLLVLFGLRIATLAHETAP